ncbi:unnamed protein product [Chondrus crispus]|uniref:Uncharacterized protein n=1 Tax=Chondrus crispus TaxID=2769 RepID=R7Q447_CHOCR|nr:unnamed protein product [Chondrus crispus]CDF32643.1 unnamed protein product [Chondrus crispus]|eukprot:XP_005712415.1 unnamed protein product [Chondrus crispus]
MISTRSFCQTPTQE